MNAGDRLKADNHLLRLRAKRGTFSPCREAEGHFLLFF
ncbi:hypothetical protein OCAR_6876 [Afipia carboxidovorans OM5]|nr:hypothetical protein OCAR_6876 [Afipia carboxidovorans OM5]